jgi:hypothetical protein
MSDSFSLSLWRDDVFGAVIDKLKLIGQQAMLLFALTKVRI